MSEDELVLVGEEVPLFPAGDYASADLVEPNPMVRGYGAGPEGKRCADCAHLFCTVHGGKRDKRYWKCRFRGCTHGPGTDHRVRWRACRRFEQRSEEGGSDDGADDAERVL